MAVSQGKKTNTDDKKTNNEMLAAMITLSNKFLKKATLSMGETKKNALSKPARSQMLTHIKVGETLRTDLSKLATQSQIDKQVVMEI